MLLRVYALTCREAFDLIKLSDNDSHERRQNSPLSRRVIINNVLRPARYTAGPSDESFVPLTDTDLLPLSSARIFETNSVRGRRRSILKIIVLKSGVKDAYFTLDIGEDENDPVPFILDDVGDIFQMLWNAKKSIRLKAEPGVFDAIFDESREHRPHSYAEAFDQQFDRYLDEGNYYFTVDIASFGQVQFGLNKDTYLEWFKKAGEDLVQFFQSCRQLMAITEFVEYEDGHPAYHTARALFPKTAFGLFLAEMGILKKS